MSGRRYSVKHAQGWCALKRGHVPQEGEWNTPTACGLFVVAPFDFAHGLKSVTCVSCRDAERGAARPHSHNAGSASGEEARA